MKEPEKYPAALIAGLSIFVLILMISRCSDRLMLPVSSLRSSIVETGDFFEVTGLGASSPGENISEAQAKRNAGEIAHFQAVELLVEAMQGVGISGNVKLRDLHMSEGTLIQLISARLQGVQQVGTIKYEKQADGSWIAAYTLQYAKKTAEQMLDDIAGGREVEELVNKRDPALQSYTGIIIDMRFEFDFNAIFSPVVLSSSHKEVFSVRDIDSRILLSNGGIPVFASIREAVSLSNGVGDRPLKLIPEKYDSVTGAIILSELDSRRLLSLSNKEQLFKQGKIALILE